MISAVFLIITFGLVIYYFYKRCTKNYDYFEKLGLKYVKPTPILGVNGFVLLGKGHIGEMVETFYNQFPNEKVFGAFDFNVPLFMIRDLNLIKQIAVKDFLHFQDHRVFFDTESDDFFSHILISMKGKQWRDMRSSVSPLFTGSKMRLMFELIIGCSQQFVNFINEDIGNGKKKTYAIKDTFSRITNDMIASCAFGLEVDSLRNPKNEIFLVGQEFVSFQKFFKMIKLLFIRIAPKISRILGLRPFSKKVEKVFYDMIVHTMRVRKEKNIYRPDMINLLMNLKDGDFASVYSDIDKNVEAERNIVNGEIKNTWTDKELIAQSFIFYLAGSESTSTVMQFIVYDLAVHTHVQDKLRKEIKEIREKLDGRNLTYDAMKEMKYMTNVIHETLRYWTPAPVLDRICVQDYEYEDKDGFKLKIKKGDMVWIPAYGIHHDPKYFADPRKFDPERYEDGRVNMDAWMPFGIGPRNCIGLRFAMMEMKALLYYLLLNYKINVCKETVIPLILKKSVLGAFPEKPIKLEFEKI